MNPTNIVSFEINCEDGEACGGQGCTSADNYISMVLKDIRDFTFPYYIKKILAYKYF